MAWRTTDRGIAVGACATPVELEMFEPVKTYIVTQGRTTLGWVFRARASFKTFGLAWGYYRDANDWSFTTYPTRKQAIEALENTEGKEK